MKTIFFSILGSLVISFSAHAQVQNNGWLASFNTFKLKGKFSAHFEVQLRGSDKFENLQTVIIRPGINYHITKSLIATMGYAYIPGRRIAAGVTGYLPEHRIWQQLIFNQKIKNISIGHRLRFEERFIPNTTVVNNELQVGGFSKAYRLRYFIRNIIPLGKQPIFKKGLFFALQNEVFANTGDGAAVNGKFFDQNRFYTAFGYRFPTKIDIEAGYLNQYIAGKTSTSVNHIIQLAVYKRL